MHSLVLFSHIAAQSTFTTSEIYADTVAAREVSKQDDRLASLRYDLSKLRAKVLVERVPRSRRYRLLRGGYTPSAGIPETVRADVRTLDRGSAVSGFHRQSASVVHSTASIPRHGRRRFQSRLKPTRNESKILVTLRITV